MTAALRMRLTGEDEKRLTKSYTANPEAYQLYLQGRFGGTREPRMDSTRASNIFSRRSKKILATLWPMQAWPIATVHLQANVLFPPRRIFRKRRRPR